MGADPVNLASGNYTYQHTDFRLAGIGAPLEFQRYYNSRLTSQDPFPLGYGWSFGPFMSVAEAENQAVVTYADGHGESYTNSNGAYLGSPGVFDQLVKNLDNTWLLITKSQTTNHLDTTGRLVASVDRNGNATQLAYDAATGRLAAITNAAGRYIHINPSQDNPALIGSVEDTLGRHISFTYDAQTNLVAVTNAVGGVTRFAYDAEHRLTDLWDNRGNLAVHNDYDTNLDVVAHQYDGYTNHVYFGFDFVNHVTVQTNALGGVSTYSFDDNLLLTQVVDEAGRTNSFAYDGDRNRILVRDGNDNETHYSYDAWGNVTNKTDALNQVTSIAYNERNNPIWRIDALSNATAFGYDDYGNLTSTTNALNLVSAVRYDSRGLPIVLTDARGYSTTNEYDTAGNLVAVIDTRGDTNRFVYDLAGRKREQVDALDRTNRFVYDDNDNLLQTVNALGFTNSFTYDLNDNRTSSTDARGAETTSLFDLKDRLIAVTDNLGNTVTNGYDVLDRKVTSRDARHNFTYYGYDPVGNLLSVTNALDQVTHFLYDRNGNQTIVTDPDGNSTTNVFDALNRRVLTIDPLAHTTASGYDGLSRVIATTNGLGQVTRFFYDAIGRLTNVVDAATNSVFFAYDANGNRIVTTDPNGHSSTNHFDELNRMVEQDDPLGNKTFLYYNAVGTLTNKVTPNGDSIVYDYDALNRLTNIAYPSGPRVMLAYDENGNRTNMVDALGNTVWDYDSLNRLKAVTDPSGNVVQNEFDENGNRVTLTYPDGNTVHYGYDALNRMASLTNWLGGVVAYTYDARGNLLTTTNANQTTALYRYDAANRLVTLTNFAPGASVIASYSISLDAIGNRTNSVQTQPLVPILRNQTNTYTYDEDNRLTTVEWQTVTHNANGDLTSIGTNVRYGYDYEDRLTSFTVTNITGTCAYDGLGSRLSRTLNGQTTRFVLDRLGALTQVLVETDTTGAPTAYYIYGLGLVQRIAVDGSPTTYHYDILGSTVALSDTSGGTTDSYAYDSFGVLANYDSASSQPFRYLGRYGILDEGNGLYHARARYFNADLGRSITPDPVGGMDNDQQSLNRYIYARDNPVRLIDVTGLSAREGRIELISGTTDADHSYLLVNDRSRKLYILRLKAQIAQQNYILALEEEDINYEMWMNIFQGIKDASASMLTFYASGGTATLPALFQQANTFHRVNKSPQWLIDITQWASETGNSFMALKEGDIVSGVAGVAQQASTIIKQQFSNSPASEWLTSLSKGLEAVNKPGYVPGSYSSVLDNYQLWSAPPDIYNIWHQ